MSAVLEQLDTFGPQRCERLTYEQAHEYTRRFAHTQYENFTVVSWLLPVRLRADFQHVYAFCRWADDLGDETGDTDRSHELLAWWRDELTACYQGDPRHPVFVALAPTIEQHDIPRKPFDDLIDAFVQDQTVTRYDTWDQAIDYCTRSADPVGRLVLYLCGYRDAQRQQFSDATCTALQLINFWQDVRRDIIERDRVYVPRDIASKHGLDVDTLVMAVQHDEQAQRNPSCGCPPHVPSAGIHALLPAYKATIRELVERTQPLFERGKSLWPLVSPDVRVDVELFTRGGEAIARMIHRVDYDTLQVRPSLGKAAKVVLMMRAAVGKLLSPARSGRTS